MSTTPTHGKHCGIYRLRPGGFVGAGLNDLTWGTAASNAATAYYEVEIDAEDTPDTFRWRKNGGAWTEDVAITGAAQTLDEGQTITFAATTGHTLGDKWAAGNLVAEPCTESTNTAQITSTARRIINPNRPPTWTDSGGKTALQINYTNATAVFSGNVGTVTVSGNLGFIPEAALEHLGYHQGFDLSVQADMSDASRCGEDWKEGLPGQAGGSGSINNHLIGGKTWLGNINAALAGTMQYMFLKLLTNDPDKDGTGDFFGVWALPTGDSVSGQQSDLVKESFSFQIHGPISYTPAT